MRDRWSLLAVYERSEVKLWSVGKIEVCDVVAVGNDVTPPAIWPPADGVRD